MPALPARLSPAREAMRPGGRKGRKFFGMGDSPKSQQAEVRADLSMLAHLPRTVNMISLFCQNWVKSIKMPRFIVLYSRVMPLDVLIEAMLFYKATPLKKASLRKLFDVSEADFVHALEQLRHRLEFGATRLVETEVEVSLATAPELSEFVESLRKAELKGDIGKAGAETLAIIL